MCKSFRHDISVIGLHCTVASHKSSSANLTGLQTAKSTIQKEKYTNPEMALLRNASYSPQVHPYIHYPSMSFIAAPSISTHLSMCTFLVHIIIRHTRVCSHSLRGYVGPAESDLTCMPHPTCINIHLAAQWDTLHQWLTTLHLPPPLHPALPRPPLLVRWHDETEAIQRKYRIEGLFVFFRI